MKDNVNITYLRLVFYIGHMLVYFRYTNGLEKLLWDTYPVHSAEVDCLSKVEALIEATVISSGKRDDKLTSTLVCSVNLKHRDDSFVLPLLSF